MKTVKNVARIAFPNSEMRDFEALSGYLSNAEGVIEVEISEGTYCGKLCLKNARADSIRIVGEGNVTVSGAEPRKAVFRKESDRIVVAEIEKGLSFERLKIDGEQGILARYPNYKKENGIFGGTTDVDTLNKRARRYRNPETGYVRGLHEAEWGGNDYKILSADAKGLRLAWIGNNNRGSAVKTDCVYVENIFEELDSEKEWFYEPQSGKLYLYRADYRGEEIRVEPFTRFDLVEIKGCGKTSVSIENIRFADTDRTLLNQPWARYLRSDWAYQSAAAVTVEESENIAFRSCRFENLGGTAVLIQNYNRNVVVSDCDFTECLSNGILILGNPDSTYNTSAWENDLHRTELEFADRSGTKSDRYPRDILIENCYFYDLGLEDKQSAGVCMSLSYRVTVRSSTFHKLPRAAINIAENAFGGHLVEDCDLFDCVRETGDHGPFNSWGRDRFWSLAGFDTNGGNGLSKKPYYRMDMLEKNVLRHNRVVGSKGFGIDLDDGSSNYLIENNLCINKGIKLREGFDRVVRNNFIVNAPLDLHATYAGNDDVVEHNVVLCKNPLNVILLNKGFTTRIEDNLFVNANASTAKSKILKNRRNAFIEAEASEILSQTLRFDGVDPISTEFGKQGKPQPEIDITAFRNAANKTRNRFGVFSDVDEGVRTIAGASGYDGVFVSRLSVFSPLKRLGIKASDLILAVDGNPVSVTTADFGAWKPFSEILLLRNQKKCVLKGGRCDIRR